MPWLAVPFRDNSEVFERPLAGIRGHVSRFFSSLMHFKRPTEQQTAGTAGWVGCSVTSNKQGYDQSKMHDRTGNQRFEAHYEKPIPIKYINQSIYAFLDRVESKECLHARLSRDNEYVFPTNPCFWLLSHLGTKLHAYTYPSVSHPISRFLRLRKGATFISTFPKLSEVSECHWMHGAQVSNRGSHVPM